VSLPEWVQKFKEPRTEIKVIKGNYYKYEVKSIYNPNTKRSVKKTLRLLGKITADKGFVPSQKNKLREDAKNPKVDIKTYGVYSIFEELLQEEIQSLSSIFGKKLTEEILSFAMLRWAYQTTIRRAANYHSHSFCSEFWSTDRALTDKILTAALKEVGENREKVLAWMRKLLPTNNDNLSILMDSTHVVTQSEYLEINAPGYNPTFDFGKQIRLMYMFSAELRRPIYYKLINGNLSDIATLASCVEEMNVKDAIFIADKGFYSAENIKMLEKNNLHYLIPLKRNNSVIDYQTKTGESFKKNCDYFVYQKRIIWYYQYEKEGKKYVTFLDDKLRVEEESDYLLRVETHPEEYTKAGYLGKLHTFGTLTMTYKTKAELSAKEIYEIYKKRNEIEIMFDSYKNFLNADKMYMQNRYVLDGWLFCNFLAMIAYYNLFERLRSARLLDKMSPKDVIELCKPVYQMRINGIWRVSEISKKTRELFKKLKLYSLT
jgi:hypothetical protein